VGAFFGLMIVMFIVWAIVKAAAGSTSSYQGLTTKGMAARGILLQVDSVGYSIEGMRAQRIERRAITVDVEIPGQAPYVVSTNAYVPKNLARDVLPGATVELRVDPRNKQYVAIVGPGAAFAAAALLAPGAASQDQRTS
jgi:hypothetical protein